MSHFLDSDTLSQGKEKYVCELLQIKINVLKKN